MSVLAGTARFVRAHPLPIAVSVSAALAALYVAWQPHTTDLAAQTFRADLWDREGFVIWNPDWYGGHTVPGYSLLFPPLGASLGPGLVGALSAVAATWLFGLLALSVWGERAWLGVIWFGFASAAAIFSGRITFALGLALALAALLAIQRRRPAWAALAALLTSAASPVAGLFLRLACAAILLDARFPIGGGSRKGAPVRPAAAAAAGAALALVALVIAFPTDGYQPFAFDSFIWIPLVALVTLALVGRREGVLLWGALLYVVLGLIALAIETPLGGNAVRLGATFAGPLLAILLLPRRPLLLALLVAPLLWWQWTTTVNDVAATLEDGSGELSYYQPLLDRLGELDNGDGALTVHVPPTRNRWEAVHVAERYPITRGWLRQLESDDFDLFDDGNIDRDDYLRWLELHGADYVAANDAEPDYLAESELRLLDSGALDDREVWSDGPWRLYSVRSPSRGKPSSGPVRELGPDRFSVELGRDPLELPLRYTSYLEVVDGRACVERGPGGRTKIVPAEGAASQRVVVAARLSLAAVAGRDRHCRTA